MTGREAVRPRDGGSLAGEAARRLREEAARWVNLAGEPTDRCPHCDSGIVLVEIEKGNSEVVEIAQVCSDCQGSGLQQEEATNA